MGGAFRLNEWDIYSLDGWGSEGKVSSCFLGDMLKNSSIHDGNAISYHLTSMMTYNTLTSIKVYHNNIVFSKSCGNFHSI